MPKYKVTAKLMTPTYVYTITAKDKDEAQKKARELADETYDATQQKLIGWKINLKLYKPLG